MAQSLVLVRHGLIEANRLGLWHGSTDSPLLGKGRRQAQRTGAELVSQEPHPVAVYTSPLLRCQDTARFVTVAMNAHAAKQQRRAKWSNRMHRLTAGTFGRPSPATNHTPMEPVVVDDLREYAIGEWEGLPFSELARTHQFIERAAADLDYAPPQGESLREVSQRISTALLDLHHRHGPDEHVLVVAHGAVLAVGLATLLNNDPALWRDYHFDNCSLSELALEGLPELRRFNLTGHL